MWFYLALNAIVSIVQILQKLTSEPLYSPQCLGSSHILSCAERCSFLLCLWPVFGAVLQHIILFCKRSRQSLLHCETRTQAIKHLVSTSRCPGLNLSRTGTQANPCSLLHHAPSTTNILVYNHSYVPKQVHKRSCHADHPHHTLEQHRPQTKGI